MRGGYNCNCGTPTYNSQSATEQSNTEATSNQNNMPSLQGGAKKGAAKKTATKRKLTPYNIFVKKQFAILKAKFPNDTAPQIMKKIGAEWRKQ